MTRTTRDYNRADTGLVDRPIGTSMSYPGTSTPDSLNLGRAAVVLGLDAQQAERNTR